MKRRASRCVVLALALLLSHAAEAALINGDFETGDLTGWETALTPVGTFGDGFPRVQTFDVDQDGSASLAAQFSVGKSMPFESQFQTKFGGWIVQTVAVAGGDYTLSADVSAFSTVGNSEAGLFELLFDGSIYYDDGIKASVDFGSIAANATEWARLSAVLPNVSPGTHSIGVRITREFSTSAWTSLTQTVDDVRFVAIPEPGTAWLLLSGVSWIAWRERRRKA
jgi:hypothetical protein